MRVLGVCVILHHRRSQKTRCPRLMAGILSRFIPVFGYLSTFVPTSILFTINLGTTNTNFLRVLILPAHSHIIILQYLFKLSLRRKQLTHSQPKFSITHGGILPSDQHISELVWLFVLNRQSITLFSGYNTIEDLQSLLWRKEMMFSKKNIIAACLHHC